MLLPAKYNRYLMNSWIQHHLYYFEVINSTINIGAKE